jgi:hypothetical protein
MVIFSFRSSSEEDGCTLEVGTGEITIKIGTSPIRTNVSVEHYYQCSDTSTSNLSISLFLFITHFFEKVTINLIFSQIQLILFGILHQLPLR